MPRKPNPPPDDAEQAARFIETAKELEADKTGEAFSRALSAVIPTRPAKPRSKKDSDPEGSEG